MKHEMNKPPPMDLPSERLILTLKISPSNQSPQPLTTNGHKNNAVTQGYCTVGERKYVGQVTRCEIYSKFFLIDFPKEWKAPPLKNKLWKWCYQPSTATPYNTTQL